jgi:hypothetical protein
MGWFHLKIFSKTTGPILTRLGTNHPWWREFKFLQMTGIAPLQEEIIAKNLLLHNQQAKINQTWYKLSLGEGNSSLSK